MAGNSQCLPICYTFQLELICFTLLSTLPVAEQGETSQKSHFTLLSTLTKHQGFSSPSGFLKEGGFNSHQSESSKLLNEQQEGSRIEKGSHYCINMIFTSCVWLLFMIAYHHFCKVQFEKIFSLCVAYIILSASVRFVCLFVNSCY